MTQTSRYVGIVVILCLLMAPCSIKAASLFPVDDLGTMDWVLRFEHSSYGIFGDRHGTFVFFGEHSKFVMVPFHVSIASVVTLGFAATALLYIVYRRWLPLQSDASASTKPVEPTGTSSSS